LQVEDHVGLFGFCSARVYMHYIGVINAGATVQYRWIIPSGWSS